MLPLNMTDSYGDGWNGAVYTLTDADGNVLATGDLDSAQQGDGTTQGSDIVQIGVDSCGLGCTDPAACNYDDEATLDDGTCDFDCNGCTDPEACNYDPTATQDDGSCLANDECGVCGGDNNSCTGCTDSPKYATSSATIDDGSCILDSEDLTIIILTDNYPANHLDGDRWLGHGCGIRWALRYGRTEYVEQVCIDAGCYTFTISDSFGDGVCCATELVRMQ